MRFQVVLQIALARLRGDCAERKQAVLDDQYQPVTRTGQIRVPLNGICYRNDHFPTRACPAAWREYLYVKSIQIYWRLGNELAKYLEFTCLCNHFDAKTLICGSLDEIRSAAHGHAVDRHYAGQCLTLGSNQFVSVVAGANDQ